MRRMLICAALLFSPVATALELTETQKLDDLNQAVMMIKAGYGPLVYKKVELGIDVDALRDKYTALIKQTTTNAQFYYLINQFIAEFQDAHFSAALPTDYEASLGFTTDLVEGKVVIDSIDRTVLTAEDFPYQRGDEVVAMDGVGAAELLKHLASYRGMGFELAALRTAAMMVAVRRGATVPVPTGKTVVELRPRLQAWLTKTEELTWRTKGTPFDEQSAAGAAKTRVTTPTFQQAKNLSLAPMWDDVVGRDLEKSFRCSGTTRIAIPKDATKILEKPFVAYYHKHPTDPTKTVGYLRIPHYSPSSEGGGIEQFEIRFRQYEKAIAVLEAKTDGLIIDQDHNCGGSVDWLERLLGLFLTSDFEPMQFEARASKAEYLEFKGWLPEAPEGTLARDQLQSILDTIKATWEKGEEYLTPKVSFTVPGKAKPHGIHYTKPIVMLIDELSGSGGDAFPALMQGNGRAKLLGTRTMGAGGHVTVQPSLFNSGISVRMTKSLFYRPDGIAVENHGAEPDYPYTITTADYVDQYAYYQKFYLEKLLALMN